MVTQTKTTTAHIGLERYRGLAKDAIEISYKLQSQVTAAQFMKFIIDNYSAVAKAEMIKRAGVLTTEVS